MIISPSDKPNYHVVLSTGISICIIYYLFERFYGEIAETHSGQTLVERAFLMGLTTVAVFALFEITIKHIFFSPTIEGILAWHIGQSLASGLVAFYINNYFEGHPVWDAKALFLFTITYGLACVPGIYMGYLIHKKVAGTDFDEDLKYIIVKSPGNMELMVDPRHIMFVMEEDSSIRIFYLDTSEIKSKLIDKNLSVFEKEFKDIPFLLKCHKAYIVNINQVSEVVRNNQQIQLHYSSQYIIPVDERYKSKILDKIK